MSIAILSAKTGGGHNAIMKAISEELRRLGKTNVLTFESFYEDLTLSNRSDSDFYNFLLVASIEMAAKFVEFGALKGNNYHELSYAECREKLHSLICSDELQAIVSTTPLINRNVIRAIDEAGLTGRLPFYVVVTDPFDPIAPGFSDRGATCYFCPTDIVRVILEKSKIPSYALEVTGYPVSMRFERSRAASSFDRLGQTKRKRTILLNAGTAGASHYIEFLEIACRLSEFKIIMLCGNNRYLLNEASKLIERNKWTDATALPLSNDLDKILVGVDIVVTKPGANTFFECISAGIPMILDAAKGFLYQERGVTKFLQNNPVAVILNDTSQLKTYLQTSLEPDGWWPNALRAISEYSTFYGARNIAQRLVNDINSKMNFQQN